MSHSGPAAVTAVLAVVDRGGLLAQGARAVVLLSGGRDSVCALDVCRLRLGAPNTFALHVNYGLRPEARAEEEHCRALCDRLGVGLQVLAAGPAPPGNLQAWARELRYDAAERLGESRRALVVSGHTASDQAETVLYRLACSPGRRALMGIPATRGRIVRPLLEVTRVQTTAYCQARELRFCDDPTNTSPRYARGRVRNRILPALQSVHPAAEANLAASAALLREEGELLDTLADAALGGRSELPANELGTLAPALGRLVLARLADRAAGTPVPGAGRRLERVLALAQHDGSAELDLGAGAQAVIEYGHVRVTGPASGKGREAPADGAAWLGIPGRLRIGPWQLSADLAPAADVDPADWVAHAQSTSRGVLDADLLAAGAVVRPWRPGDRMRPLGVGGSRPVSDLLGERRVPRSERSSRLVIECEGEIAWVPGVATSEPHRLTARSARAALLQARRSG